jgi:modulator of FtsH protease
MNPQSSTATVIKTTEINKVLRNTYALLSMTLLFSAVTAGIGMALEFGRMTSLFLGLGALVPLFITYKNAESSSGLAWIFVFTGMEGASLGWMLNHYMGMTQGPQLIMQALGLTSAIFLGLSAYVITTKKDFSFLRGFLFAGLLVMLGCALINMFMQSSVAFLAINAAVAMLMTGFILYDTSRIIHGGETNYIRATIALYLDFINLFISLLHLLGFANDE